VRKQPPKIDKVMHVRQAKTRKWFGESDERWNVSNRMRCAYFGCELNKWNGRNGDEEDGN